MVVHVERHDEILKAMNIQVVNNIEPLGFQWKASDPFLFCVHHKDCFPEVDVSDLA